MYKRKDHRDGGFLAGDLRERITMLRKATYQDRRYHA